MTWEMVPLAELGTWTGGGTPSKSRPDYWDGEIPWLSPKDMGSLVLADTQDHISTTAVAESSTKLVPAGAVAIVTRSGILEHTLPSTYVPFDVTLNQDMKALAPRAGVDPKWVLYGLRAFERQILSNCRKAGTTVASIELRRLENFRIPVPSLAEQRRIVELVEEQLSHLDAADAALAQAIERASLLPRLTAETGWHDTDRRIPLGTLGKTVTGNTPRESQTGHLTPFITPGDVMHGDQISTVERSLSLDEFSKARVSDGPTVYVVCIGATLGKTGWREEIAAFNQQINTLNLPSAEAAAVMSALLASPSGQTELRREVAATTMPILNKTKFSRVLVPSLTTVQIADIHQRLQLVQASTSQTLGDLHRAQQQSVALRRVTLAAAFAGRLTGSSSDAEVIEEMAEVAP